MTSHTDTSTTDLSDEHQDLLGTLALHRHFLVTTADGLDERQARLTPTASSLSVGGIIKHVAATEGEWLSFVLNGAPGYETATDHRPEGFVLQADETLAGVLADYEAVAARTAEVVGAAPDLNASQLLPEAPWFPPGAAWSVRRVMLHLIAETAQHAGHADIIRESIDGAK
ncbi:MAG: DinB family protein, partial [Microthrixaceae bacterium]|nr:DinB family protein [Microthrixaceae bacterium]